jgi:2-polyprenyl-6-hydroxyphenyl methylase/3-demethylubiquinone-9 3-methyltransferase
MEIRFAFGKNWTKYLELVDEDRIESARQSFASMLGTHTLEGLRFLDVGSGSGLFSLAAQRMGASVTSFDYDPEAVACCKELQRRFGSEEGWKIERGSALDTAYLDGLGRFDLVYSWGVLHHTGDMWSAIDNVAGLVAPNGRLFISIYNDQNGASVRWRKIKRFYNQAPAPVRIGMLVGSVLYFDARPIAIAQRLIHLQHPFPRWAGRAGRPGRGMSPWRDMIDWVGGYPFEVAKPEEVIHRLLAAGFELNRLKTCGGGLGCNEFLLTRR